jgi:hypothetical protein
MKVKGAFHSIWHFMRGSNANGDRIIVIESSGADFVSLFR